MLIKYYIFEYYNIFFFHILNCNVIKYYNIFFFIVIFVIIFQ
jgi:hypothetical protein